MRKIFLTDYMDLCHRINPACYIFSSENQKDLKSCMVHGKAKFTKTSISFCPNRIYFEGDNERVCFKRVKHIIIGDPVPDISVPFEIICEDENHTNKSISVLAMLYNVTV